MSVRANFADIYLWGMRDRSMRSGRQLASQNIKVKIPVFVFFVVLLFLFSSIND